MCVIEQGSLNSVEQGTLTRLPPAPPQFLNIGSSYNTKPESIGWVNFDLLALQGVGVQGDANILPFKDSSFLEVNLEHVYEHIPEPLALMEEVYRVCKHEAMVTIRCPYYRHMDAFGDPGHVHAINEQSFVYLLDSHYGNRNRMSQYEHKFRFKTKAQLKIKDIQYNHPMFEKYEDIIWGVTREIVCMLTAIKPEEN